MNRSQVPVHAAGRPGRGWRDFAATQWAREAVVVPDAPPLGIGPADAHALLVAAAASRTARPRLTTTDGQLRDPGRLLPGPADADLAGYADRLAAEPRLAGDGWLLTVRDPFGDDFARWSRVRDVLAGLWRHIGRPALPVTAELAVGDRHHAADETTAPADAAALTWVIDGSLTVRVRPEHTGTEYELHARAGDLVHWPAGSRHLDHRAGRCTTLRLAVPARATSALPLVADVVTDQMRRHPRYANGQVVLPHPVPAAADGRLVPPSQLTGSADQFADTLAGPGPERALLLRWAGLRSAEGLDPAPPLRAGVRLTPHHRLLRTADIVRVGDTPDHAFWAANGHTWPAPGAGADRALTALRTARDGLTVAQLARACAVPADDTRLHALLGAAYRARAVAATAPERRP
ncbi:hypothetical protein ACIBL6_41130 [Streptomyces sp. NPDC050400]|uniref:hypothetical protein n=1 Tax=Streptomyces sp. NPDC050400 TaxID=3365610 RepID=UPI0037B2FC16